MAFLPVVFAVASAAVSAYGAISAAKAQSASYKSSAEAANYNATVNKQNAMSAEAAASANELNIRRQNDQILGRERASVGESAGGFTGTNVGVLAQNGANLELNALNERYKGKIQANALLAGANMNEFQANVANQNASASTTAGYFGAASSALGAVSSYSNSRYLYTGGG